MELIARIDMPSNFSSKFKANIMKEVSKRIKAGAPKIRTVVLTDVRRMVKQRLVSSREYDEMASTGGKLRGELGVVDGQGSMDAIIETWVNGIEVIVKSGSAPNLLLIDIGMIQQDYSDVLGLSAASYTYQSQGRLLRGQNITIPWLEWLLLKGPTKIVRQYRFYGRTGLGRTGLGIMVAKGSWNVPAEYSGTSENNFATRALAKNKIDVAINGIVEKALRGVL
jgi:hypothetical protein